MIDLVKQHEPLSEHCRFKVGGPADHFALVTNIDELTAALRFASELGLRHFVYGGGSNLFFDDEGFRGLVIRLQDGGYGIDEQTPAVIASAGFDLGTMVRELASHNLGGIEFLANIPGSVGGAIVGNAGCYGMAIADRLVSAKVYDTMEQTTLNAGPEFFEFAYRHSKLKHDNRYVLTQATIKLTERQGTEIMGEITNELTQRLIKHPHDTACAGSFFKNPSRDQPAWQVITDAGLAGTNVGEARLSEMHANFLINVGDATSSDIIALVKKIQRGVQAKLGVELSPEVRYVSPTGIRDILPN